ncbi:hypothetical protein HM131_03680 [Halobacillus mangrovi]|uniref:Uncharacterized protein n=1 Tax=Halobacillus mangrovi TaxID=402384 RepID=A0A1W5ZRT3_9BACI|nr:hypothetical protein HM131_03680 [Halobacillus mangrovi]
MAFSTPLAIRFSKSPLLEKGLPTVRKPQAILFSQKYYTQHASFRIREYLYIVWWMEKWQDSCGINMIGETPEDEV